MFVAPRYATEIWSGSNACRFSICDSQVIEFKFSPIPKGMGLFSEVYTYMDTGHFYFLRNQYFIDFPDPYLMQNKEKVNGQTHNRPCFYAFEDVSSKGLFWLVPFSSQTNKFQSIYNTKIAKYHICDTIVFGDVLGSRKAFLIQNMCPVISKYINNEYIDSSANIPVRISGSLEKDIITKAKRVLALQRQGKKLIFPDVLKIESALKESLKQE